MKSLELVI